MALPNNAAKLFENFTEVENPEECYVKGQIPSWLSVTLVRNGPGMFQIGDTEYKHWFDGLAYIQRYYFKNGKMLYSAKYLRSEAYKRNLAAQRIVIGEFGTASYPDPCKSIFTRYFNYLFSNELTDNAVVNFMQCGDQVFATTELPVMTKIDLKTLETCEKVDISKYVVMNMCTAHHHYDKDGNVYNIGSRFGKNGQYIFTKTENPNNCNGESVEKTTKIGSIPFESNFYPTYYHSFGMTKNY
uniref:Uncharacterized protein n=1 Tax=Acrobeloides nanus TaxID=290746 RepID=A0A914EDL0_9BILA